MIVERTYKRRIDCLQLKHDRQLRLSSTIAVVRAVAKGLSILMLMATVSQKSYADSGPVSGTQANKTTYTIAEVLQESLAGDVYAHPENWEELGVDELFSKGWNKPWVSPPNGAGGAPRQGWLNAYDAVFYRLSVAIFGWQHNMNGGDGYTGRLYSYTSLSERFELQTNIPLVSSSSPTDASRETHFGDVMIGPTIMLSESRALSQSLLVAFTVPTGNSYNGNGVASVAPTYQFWANWWKGLVVRGGAGFTIPYAGRILEAGARTTFNANMAVGYYFTEHNALPFGDMVWYVAGNLGQAIDQRGLSGGSTFSLGPGFRTHVGDNWYLLGSVDFPVTNPQPYDYQVQSAIMKVY